MVLLFTKKLDFTTLVGTAAGLSNAFGLIVSILLLGYGLVRGGMQHCPPLHAVAHYTYVHACILMLANAHLQCTKYADR